MAGPRKRLNWSPQQRQALRVIGKWVRDPDRQVARLFGVAGTGKSTLAAHLAKDVEDVRYAAFTGKAASVMRAKGCVGASTVHSLIYQPVEDPETGKITFRLNEDSSLRDADLLILDEASMIPEDMGKDLMSFGVPILVLGDPGQLPPVHGAGFFMGEPDVLLTEVHRQAKDSPIIQLATTVRTGGSLLPGEYGTSRVVDRGVLSDEEILKADQVIVGTNRTRQAYNRRIRQLLGRTSKLPMVGERLICLKNDRLKGIYNGGMYEVRSVITTRDFVLMDVAGDGVEAEVMVRKEFFLGMAENLKWEDLRVGQQFDYGYAVTCHKAQGSQWDNTIVYDEGFCFRENAQRWTYTAITRASDRVTVVRCAETARAAA